VLDFVNGRKDLAAGLLRTVGRPEQRFSEDKLRVIRAVRFACQLGFRIEEETWRQVVKCAGLTRQVSWERIRDEIKRIFAGPRPALGLQLLLDSGILKVILPEVEAMVGVQQPPQFHPEGDVFVHTKKLFELADPPLDPVLAMGMLLHDVGKPPTFTVEDRIRFNGHAEVGAEMARTICDRFRFPTDFTNRVVALVKGHLRFIPVKQMRESTLKRFLRTPHFDQHLELHRLDCLASHEDLSSYRFCREKLRELSEEEMRPTLFLNGHDLIAQGLDPGPVFSEILRELEDLQLEGRIKSREEALTWIKERQSKIQ
jgi:poly(A) polymerase